MARRVRLRLNVHTPGLTFCLPFNGYEDWAVVSSARAHEALKVIVANPTMIEAYNAGVPGNGQPFPDGSKIVKLQWNPAFAALPFGKGRAPCLSPSAAASD